MLTLIRRTRSVGLRRAVQATFGRIADTAPIRTPDDRCGADDCTVVDNPFAIDITLPGGETAPGGHRAFPYGDDELSMCEVPAADETKSALRPSGPVADARPDLIPVWCGTCRVWLHSAPCYSTHHHPGWQPARETPIGRKGRRPGRPGRKG